MPDGDSGGVSRQVQRSQDLGNLAWIEHEDSAELLLRKRGHNITSDAAIERSSVFLEVPRRIVTLRISGIKLRKLTRCISSFVGEVPKNYSLEANDSSAKDAGSLTKNLPFADNGMLNRRDVE